MNGGIFSTIMKNKYLNKKTIIDNIKFDSKAEAKRYNELKLLLKAGEITQLEIHPRFTLLENGKNKHDQGYGKITYIADFMYINTNDRVITAEDVKGVKTQTYSVKKRLFMAKYPNYKFLEIEA